LTNKNYSGTIVYQIKEVKKFLFFFEIVEYKEVTVTYPKLIFAIDEKNATDLIKFSDLWKNNKISGMKSSNYEIIEKKLYIDEIGDNEPVLFYLYTMEPKDFVSYIKQIYNEI
jgi:hypothetical protein